MKIVTLTRLRETKLSTLGQLQVGHTEVATLEDPDQPSKIWGNTRIPAGTYELDLRDRGRMTIRYRNRFPDMHKGMIWLREVPDFKWVYIHIGNFARDTSGCILVGMRRGDDRIYQSTEAYKLIYPKIAAAIKDEGCSIVVEDTRNE